MGRAPCCDKTKVKRGPWSPEEDTTLKNYLDKFGTGGNWISLPHRAGLKRCGKSCRLRWLNYLRPDIKHGAFTQEEDDIICSLYNKMGSRWSVIASQLQGRTDNDVKNRWNTKLKKKPMMTKYSTTSSVTTNHWSSASLPPPPKCKPEPQNASLLSMLTSHPCPTIQPLLTDVDHSASYDLNYYIINNIQIDHHPIILPESPPEYGFSSKITPAGFSPSVEGSSVSGSSNPLPWSGGFEGFDSSLHNGLSDHVYSTGIWDQEMTMTSENELAVPISASYSNILL